MKNDERIELIKFYEEAAGRIKERTWTMAAWVLSVSSGLIAFCYSLENDKHYLFKQESTIKAACLAGIGLCFVLGALLLSQRQHLKEYYRLQAELSNVDEDTKTLFQFKRWRWWMPWFIWLLLILNFGFFSGFTYTIIYTICHIRTG